MKKIGAVALIVILLMALPLQCCASQTITVKPNVNLNIGEISPMLYGTGIEYYAGYLSTHMNDPKLAEVFKEDNIGHIRWPNGTCALWYLWHDPAASTQYAGNGWSVLSTDTVAQFCEMADTQLVIQVNTYQFYDFKEKKIVKTEPFNYDKAASYAADWVEYCNSPNDGKNPNGGTDWALERANKGHEKPYNVKYWELGNEDWVSYYGDDLRVLSDIMAKAMKAVDPTIKTIYQGLSGDGGYFNENFFSPSKAFNEGILKPGEENTDYLSVHYYFGQRRLGGDSFVKGTESFDTYSNGWSLSDYTNNAKMQQTKMVNDNNYAIYKDTEFLTDYTAQVSLQKRDYNPNSLGNGGLIFNYKDDLNYNMAYIVGENKATYLKLISRQNGIDTVISSYKLSQDINLSDNYNIKIETRGERIKVNAWSTNQQRGPWCIDIENNLPNQFGSIGFGTMPNSTISFDEIVVYDYANVVYDNFDVKDDVLKRLETTQGHWDVTEDKKLIQQSENTNALSFYNGVDNYNSFYAKTQIDNLTGEKNAGLAFGITDKGYYSANVTKDKLVISKVENNVKSIISTQNITTDLSNDAWLKLKTEVYGKSTKIYAKVWNDKSKSGDNEPSQYNLCTIVNEPIAGKVGFNTENTSGSFDNFSVVRNVKVQDYFESESNYWKCSSGQWENHFGRLLQKDDKDQISIAYLDGLENSSSYSVSAKVFDRDYSKNSKGKAGFAFNITDNEKTFYLAYLQSESKIAISKITNGKDEKVLGTFNLPSPINISEPFFMKGEMNQKLASFKVWNSSQTEPASQLELAMTVVDEEFVESGKVGLATWGTASFDEFTLTKGQEQSISDVKGCSGAVLTEPGLDYVENMLDESGSKALMYASEYNHMEPDEEQFYYYYLQNYAHAVLIGDWLGNLIEHNCGMASYHACTGPRMFSMYDPYDGAENVKRGVQTLAFSLYSKYFGDKRIDEEISNMPVYPYSRMFNYEGVSTVNIDLISVYSSINTEKNTLEMMFISKDVENDHNVVIDLSGIPRKNTVGKIRSVGSENEITDGNLVDKSEVSILEENLDCKDEKVTVNIKAHTITEVSIPIR